MWWGFGAKVRRLMAAREFVEARALLANRPSQGSKHDAKYENMLGICEARSGHMNEARAAFGRALELSPRSAAILNNMANLEFMQEQHDLARDLYWRAIEESIWRAEPRHNMTILYQYMGYSEKALSQYRDFMYLARTTRWVWIVSAAMVILGILILKMA